MLVLFYYLFLFIITVILWIPTKHIWISIVVGLVVSAILIYIKMILFRPVSLLTTTVHQIPTHQLYSCFKKGDFIFNSVIGEFSPFQLFFINHSMFHVSMVVEENGKLFVLHSHCADMNSIPYILYQYTYFGMKWHVIKEPLEKFVLENKKSYFQIVRSVVERPLRITKDMAITNKYCCHLIGNIMYENGLIEKDKRLLSYHPAFIFNQLRKKGYETVFIEQI